ncbi:MAG TPA: type II secretion system protein N [Sphingobium sp.]|nr:type II secretion system protein N [Sphingobium sp.]
MINWLRLSRRGWVICAIAMVVALIACLPLRLAAGLFGLSDMGVAARSMSGSVWAGQAEELELGVFRLGTVDVMLSPLQLLLGRARFDISRKQGMPDDISGALSVGFATRGIDDVTGSMPLGGAFAPLPVLALEMYDVSIAFSGTRCLRAEGRMRLQVAAVLPGLDFANGLSGEARCDGADVLIPLVSQSGVERIEIRLTGEGRYRATMTIAANDPALANALALGGFRAVGRSRVLRIDGRL